MARAKRSSYLRWLIGFLAIFFGLLAAIASMNILMDGSGVFRLHSGLRHFALDLIQGRMVAGPLGGYDEREFQRLIVELYPRQRDMVAIGSSRVMSLRRRFIHGNPDFFNHSVAGAGVEDMVSIVGLYSEKGLLPKTIVLGIDPWMFNKNNGLGESWKTLDKYYRIALAEIDDTLGKTGRNGPSGTKDPLPGARLSRYKQLINLDYTVQNWESFRRGKKLRTTDTVEIDDFVREPDGSLYFPYAMRHAFMTHEDGRTAMPAPYFKDFVASDRFDLLRNLASFLTTRGVRVVFLLPPFHAAAYRSCSETPDFRITITIEQRVRELAAGINATVVGSYDPSKYGFEGKDFFDGTHGHDIVMKRLFEGFR